MKFLKALVVLKLSIPTLFAATSSYFSPLDIQKVHDLEVQNEKKGEAPSYAVAHQVEIKPQWEKVSNGHKWIHYVHAPNAVSLNFGFTKFNLPEGSEIHINSRDHSSFMRTFTSKDNNINKELWTPVILSDDVIIEVFVPEKRIQEVELLLGHIGQGFRTFSQATQNKSGSCNIDVACDESQGWEEEVNSVGVISTGGSRFCTGFMVNNTKNDKTPYFMTAAHCRIYDWNASSLVVYWNYQTSECNGRRNGRLTDFQTGSVHLASHRSSDFTLVKLLTSPEPEWNVRYAGWDATESGHDSPVVAIHHPNVDEKSISFENEHAVISSYNSRTSPGDSTHVRVIDWDLGTTEPGSSGSPLFNSSHRVVGQLHGGRAACGNNYSDYYGRFHTSWEGGGTRETSLKEHLDEANTGDLITDTI